jgi:hypothetical protein
MGSQGAWSDGAAAIRQPRPRPVATATDAGATAASKAVAAAAVAPSRDAVAASGVVVPGPLLISIPRIGGDAIGARSAQGAQDANELGRRLAGAGSARLRARGSR